MFRDMETLRDRLDHIFSDTDVTREKATNGPLVPPVDIHETESEIIVKASMPGIKTEDIEVQVDRGVLTIRGESHEKRDESKGMWHVHERRFGSMYRSFTLPVPVKEDEAEATMRDGVLEVHLPKSEPSTGKRITVKSS
jgi:HSP20 family protein